MGIAASSYKLIYFDIRGYAEVPRLLFAAAGVPYEDFRYPMSPTYERPEFDKAKAAGIFPFGQIPVLEVDGKKIPQSRAIERYLARRFGMFGDNEIETAMIDALCEQAADIRTKFFEASSRKDVAKIAELYATELEKMLQGVEKMAQANAADGGAGFLVGKRLSVADVFYYHLLTSILDAKEKVEPVLAKMPALKRVVEATGRQSGIAKYVKNRPDSWI
eukprot:tig00000057_g118.t1